MLSKVEFGKTSDENSSSSARLLRDIEEINKALYLQKTPPKALISSSNEGSIPASKTHFGVSKSKYVNEDLLQKNKKSSIWNWKPLKALTHIRNHRFNCCFFLRVHSIKGLPSNFNDLGIYIHWKRKDEVLQTCPARICQGVAEFEETLMHRCSVYGSKNGAHHSIKYEPKLFLLYASVVGSPGLDIGKHWIDLTSLLPLTLEELQEEKRSSGKWVTSFELAGKAKGAVLNVSFGFSAVGDSSFQSSSFVKVPDLLKGSGSGAMDMTDFGRTSANGLLRRLGSVPSNSNHVSHLPSRSLGIKVLNDVFPNRGSELTRSITFLYQKLDEEKLGKSEEFNLFYEQLEPRKPQPGSSAESGGENSGNESDDTEFFVIEQGVEFPMNGQLKYEEDVVQNLDGSVIENIDVAEIFKGVVTAIDKDIEGNPKDEIHGNLRDEIVVDDRKYRENSLCTKQPTIEEFESVFNNLLVSESAERDYSIDKMNFLEHENYMKTKLSHKGGKMVKSLSFDDVTESVANDFFNLLGFEHTPLDFGFDSEPESPRECLLRQFEKDALVSGNPIFDFDTIGEQAEFTGAAPTGYGRGDCSDDFNLSLVIQAAEKEHDMVSQSLTSRRDAKLLENLETEALMHEWGLNERAFQNSPRVSSGGFGSPVYTSPEEPPELPPLGEGLGPIVRTKGGGFLRSMNPSLFRNAKNGESLIMQVSCPVVLPVEMGSSGMEILQCWALVGVEKMCMQANDLMPLEDISGKTVQQVAWEVAARSDVLERGLLLLHESEVGDHSIGVRKRVEELPSSQSSDNLNSHSACGEMNSGYVFLEDLAPLAMDKIAALSIEGLRIQSGMLDEEAPSSIRVQPIGKISSSLSKSVDLRGSFSFEGISEDVDELIGLSISLDEWMRLDSEIIGDGSEISDRISKILAAHCAKYRDLISGKLRKEDKWGQPLGRRYGYLGNNFTIALKVQLRDPFRDYETVGASMVALIQVERIFVPLKPDVYDIVSERNYNGEEYDLYEQLVEKGINIEEKENRIEEEESIPRFIITEVHVAGLNTEPCKKQLWGNRTHEQSGSRWLLTSGLGKTKSYPFLKSNAIVRSSSRTTRKVRSEDTLWSISSNVHGEEAKWKELATLNLHVRNPDIVFVDESIRLPLL